MPQLDEIWQIVRSPDSLTPVWAARRNDSPLVTVPGPEQGRDGELHDPVSSVTLRMRWRDDVTTGDTLTRASDWRTAGTFTFADRVWTVGETLEIGRREWLDIGLATYPRAGTVVPDTTPDTQPPPAPPPGYMPPAGWGVTVGGEALRTLEIGQIAGSSGTDYEWQGLFDIPTGADGTVTIGSTALHARAGVPGAFYLCGHVVRTGNFISFSSYDDFLTGTPSIPSSPGEFYTMIVYNSLGVLVQTEIASADILTRGTHPVLQGDVINLVTAAQYETFAGR